MSASPPWLPGIVLFFALAITAALYVAAVQREQRARAAEITRVAELLRSDLGNRVQAYLDTLPGLRALSMLPSGLNDAQFERYVDGISLQRRFPGLAVTFVAKYVKPDELADFEKGVQADRSQNKAGHPDFHVYPAGARETYMAIRYIAPSTTPTLGYDLFDPAQRYRPDIDRAITSGEATATGPLVLAQHRDKEIRPELSAVVVRMPVYQQGARPSTADERRRAIWGVVGVSFGTLGLVQSVLNDELVRQFHINIVDVQAKNAGRPSLIFDSSWVNAAAATPRMAASASPVLIDVASRQWALSVTDEVPPSASWWSATPLSVAAAGVAISLLLAALIRSLVTANDLAVARVERATSDLIRNQQNLEVAQRLTKVGFYELDITTRRYTASPMVYEILGLDPKMGPVKIPQFLALIHPDDLARVNRNRELAISGGEPQRIEYRIVRPDGEIRHLDGQGFVTYDELRQPIRYSGAIQDITDRRLADEERVTREALLRFAGDIAQLGGWSMDLPPTKLIWSDQLCDIFGVPHGHTPTTREALAFYTDASRERVVAAVRQCIADATPYDLELQVTSADGESKWIRSIGEAVRAGERIVQIRGAVQDITARKRAALELAGANRALRMLTECNEALVRATTEQNLLDELCRLAVQTGGYRMAWVGYAEDTPQKHIVPRAFAGEENGYLTKVQLYWSDEDDGPSSRAIRSGKPSVVPSFNANLPGNRWVPLANEHEFPGVICLPLSDTQRCFGMLALYPTEVRELPEGELQLLRDLAENIAFGIVALRNRDAVADREERFKNLARATSDGVWDFDIATGKVWRNEGWAKMFGFTRESVIADLPLWENQVHPDDRERVVTSLQAAREGDAEFWAAEYRMYHLDGTLMHILDRAYIMRDATGKAVRMVGGMSDLTERVKSETRLRQQAALLDQAGEAIFVRALDHTIVYWNKGAERLYGWTADEVIGRSAVGFKSDPALFEAAFATLLIHDEWSGELTENTKSGETIIVDAHWTLVRDANGEPMSILAIHSDISDRRQAEALRAQKDAAELSNRSKSEFLARMSHELRTPLNSVLGFAQLLHKSPAVNADEPAKKKVGYILEAGKHLVAMIDDILDLSRIEAGVLLLTPEPVNLVNVLQDCINQSTPQAAEHDVNFTLATDSDYWIHADLKRVRQVLLNLLSNSIKYNRRGGGVDVRMTGDAHTVHVSIRDHGNGLTAQQLEGLFQPFNRLGAEVSGVEGTGIGLVIVRQLVHAMGGEIDVQSAPGEGATFTISFARTIAPLTVPKLPKFGAQAIATPRTENTGQRTVLYVEDNHANVALVSAALAGTPWLKLEIAVDGPSGLAAARNLRPDIVLLDINLPGMDGYAVFAAMQADPALARIPAIALSANAMSTEIERAQRAGFADYMTKPLNLAALLTRISELLEPADEPHS